MRGRNHIWTFMKLAIFAMAVYQFALFFIQGITEAEDTKEVVVPKIAHEEERDSFLSGQAKGRAIPVLLNGQELPPMNNEMILPAPDLAIMQREYFQLSPYKINPFIYKYKSKLPPKCDPDMFMMALVHSRPDYIRRRNAIRNTWGKAVIGSYWPGKQGKLIQYDIKMRLAFVLGQISPSLKNVYPQQMIDKEASENKDLIQGDFIDAYRNMTLKSLLGLKWVKENCPDVKFLLKSDDDMFVYLPGVLELLIKVNSTRTILGPYNGKSKVYRKGKWGLTLNEYPFPFYPPYESGSTYIFTGDLVRLFFDASEYVMPIFVDDVYITGILGKILQVNHAAQGGFSWGNSKKPTVCSYLNGSLISGTKVIPVYMHKLWDGFNGHRVINC